MDAVKKNWKQWAKYAVAAGAGYYGGPAGVEVAAKVLAALGLA